MQEVTWYVALMTSSDWKPKNMVKVRPNQSRLVVVLIGQNNVGVLMELQK